MDGVFVRDEAHANISVCGRSSGVTSPVHGATNPPPRPAIPPKPGSSKLNSAAGSISPPFAGGKQGHDFSRRHSLAEQNSSTDGPLRGKLHIGTITATSEGVTSPPLRSVLTSPQISPGSGPSHPSNKPALPPKPVVSPNSSLQSPPVTKFPLGKTPPKFPTQFSAADVSNGNIGNGQLSKTASVSCVGTPKTDAFPVLRSKPPLSPVAPGDPILSPRVLSPSQPRPSSEFFNFSSPIQNLSSANFPSTSADLNKVGGGPSPQKITQIRAKSASLGRNITFPFSSPTSSTSASPSSGTGFFARKSATLSKFLPLDLQLGGAPKAPSATAVVSPSKPKPNSLSLNPFIIQQKQQKSQTMSQANPPLLNFGRSIAFSPESPLPPPPPPRLKKKLSPVNSIGSPTTPTSPLIETNHSLAPDGPLPPPPPFSPGKTMEAFHESAEDVRTAIYAEVNKEKKWEDRRLKEKEVIERKLSLDSCTRYETPLPQKVDESSQNSTQHADNIKPSNDVLNECEAEAVKSWLRSHIENGVVVVSTETQAASPTPSNTNPFRAVTPTYQSTQTGHIYETIGDNLDGLNNNNKNDNNLNNTEEKQSPQVMRRESSTNELSDNNSFLFKLVINPKKGNADCETARSENENSLSANENEENRKNNNCTPDAIPDDATVHSSETVTIDGAPKTDVVLLSKATSPPTSAASYLIPTVVPDLSQKPADDVTSPISISSGLSKDSSSQFASNSSFHSIATVSSTATLGSSIADTPTIRQANGILRRRSWNCDRVVGSGSPTPSESSSTASSISNLPYHHYRDRSYTAGVTNRNSLLLVQETIDWVDEGELSNGVLADAENSDAPIRSSSEDVNLRKSGSGGKGFSSRRFVNSIFSSFGKGGNSSGSTSGSGQRKSLMTKGGKRGKVVSHLGDVGVSRLGRQISDSVVSTALISGPMLPSSVSFDSAIGPPLQQRAHPCVQFAPCPGEQVGESEEQGDVAVERRDNESVSSSESISGSGSGASVSGYEDILAELSDKEKKSFFVAREIMTSERTFVDVLNLITIDFPKTLEDAKRFHGSAVISKQDLDTILGGLPNLKMVNEELLRDLEERLANWRQLPKISDILVKKGPFLKLYASYIKDFQKNSMYLDQCCQRYPLFADAVKAFEMSERCKKLALKHYMLKPVQRMPQYKLLLDDYLKQLDEKESDDYEDTVRGIEIVKHVAEHANEAIQLQVNAEKLLHLQYRLSTGTVILKSDRQLLKEGELLKVCRKELQPRFFALMNDCLLCMTYHAAAGAPKDLTLRYELPLAGMRVSLSPAEDYKNEFSVISVTRSFSLCAKSSRERDEWMKALESAIEKNVKERAEPFQDEDDSRKKLGKEAPLWIADSRVTMCQLCTASFTVIFRRHHCRACGIIVCGNCSSGEAPLEYKKYSACRVCDSCYEYLLDEFDKKADEDINPNYSRATLRDRFKKVTPNVTKRATKIKRTVPSRLEVHANNSGSKISGYLRWRETEKKSWKQRWFVLIDRVLYIYAASEDIVAIKTKPLLGWKVQMDPPEPQQDGEDNAFFRLTHTNQQPMLFHATSSSTAEKWVAAMNEAVVL